MARMVIGVGILRPFGRERGAACRPALRRDSATEMGDQAHVVPRPQENMCSNNMYPLYIPLRRDDGVSHLAWLKSIWNIDFASIFHVAFYAWSPIEVTEILTQLAEACPNLQSITIGYTVSQDLASEILQDALWCGVDYPSPIRSHYRVTPNLNFFAKIFRQSAARNQEFCLEASVIPRNDEIMQPRADNNRAWGQTSLHHFFHGKQCSPTIRVVNVPLMASDALPDNQKVARKLRFLSPADKWANESYFAQRRSRDSVADNRAKGSDLAQMEARDSVKQVNNYYESLRHKAPWHEPYRGLGEDDEYVEHVNDDYETTQLLVA